MLNFDRQRSQIVGPGGCLDVSRDDEIAYKMAMLIEGECGTEPKDHVVEGYGFSRARYYQILNDYRQGGSAALCSDKRGPRQRSRRTKEVVNQIIRYRFLDPDITEEVIAQKLRQKGKPITSRSVQRTLKEFGLQKKTLRKSSGF